MLKIESLYAGYGGKTVLSDVSAEFEKGRITAIVGPNGCGKSTFLKTVSGIIRPFSGRIMVDNELLENMPRRQAAQRIAYMEQIKNIPDMTAEQLVLHGRFPHLNYPRRYSKKDKELAFKAMEGLGIAEYAENPVSSLSGGLQQVAYIAMVLCRDADYILLDEPMAYLDISNSFRFMELVKELADKGKGIVIVLHDLPLALRFANNIVVMNEGNVVMSASIDEIYNSEIINDVFGVNVNRFETKKGYVYAYV